VARSSSIPHERGEPRGVARSFALCLHDCLLGNEAGGDVAPQRHDQLARQCNDGDTFGALAGIDGAGAEPEAERAVGLMAKPEPGQLDRLVAGTPIAGLADALLTIDAATLPGTGGQSAIAGNFTAVAEVLVEQLVDQRCGEGRAERFEAQQQVPPFRHRRRSRRGL
jgi:hypothetical protein